MILTLKQAKIAVQKYGFSLKKNLYEEYELKNKSTKRIYYTDDLKDAVDTALFIYKNQKIVEINRR